MTNSIYTPEYIGSWTYAMSDEELQHYGIKRRSGRYPWGSGKDPQRSRDFLSAVDSYRAKGMSDKEIQATLGITSSQFRSGITIANEIRQQVMMDTFKSMKDRGLSNSEIARQTGTSEGTVRNYLKKGQTIMDQQVESTADILRKAVDNTGYLDVGAGVQQQLGISKEKLKAAKAELLEDGYYEHEIYVRRLNDPSKYTTVKTLTKEPDLEVVKQNADKIRAPEYYSDDGGRTYQGLGPIKDISSKRVSIRYSEDGGEDMDGVIELRRGVKDLDMGDARYAQVRMSVDGTHYLKGMAMYSDDLPDGVDIRFNTNKSKSVPKMDVLKKQDLDNPDNPFGATISRQKGALNIVNQEGDWENWSSTFSSQFLSKQPRSLVKERVDATYKNMFDEYNEIMSLTNPAVKKKLLESYADGLDSKSKHLKTLALPDTRGQVILPFPKMNPNEVYAPNYKNGDKLVLVRYPHGGTFELPELTVNNRGPAGRVIKNAKDAIGIHPSVAKKLSGADFDGDTVYTIKNNNKKVKVSRSLKELENFDPNQYAVDRVTIKPRTKQIEMGKVSNLITDMTIKGATEAELARAVKHSMVVIDSEKHKLDYKQSAIDNGISALKKKYQQHVSPVTGKQSTGASTLISRSKKGTEVGGEKVSYIDKNGKKKTRVIGAENVSLVDLFDDARKLSSGTAVENIYADYVNKTKKLATKARDSYSKIKPVKENKQAKMTYKNEVASLNSKLNTALMNAPRERQAQIMASNTYYKNRKADMTPDQNKKLKTQALLEARNRAGAKRENINITDKEWEAIQSGAISNYKLNQILNNTDLDKVKKLATPKEKKSISTGSLARAKSLLRSGRYTQAEVAADLGVSVSTLNELLKG